MPKGQVKLRLTSQEALRRPETEQVKARLQVLETQEHSHAYLTALGASGKPIYDVTNGQQFDENTATYPTGWTQADAAVVAVTNNPAQFWRLDGSPGDTSWAYRKQSPFTIGSLAADAAKSFWISPVMILDAPSTSADVNYYFGIYRNNAGAIDANTFARININWASASSLWQMRGETKNGTTQTNGTYYPLSRQPLLPLYLRVTLVNDTNRTCRMYAGPINLAVLQMLMQSATVGSGITWGQVWWQFSMSRGAGQTDRVLIGGIDYSADS